MRIYTAEINFLEKRCSTPVAEIEKNFLSLCNIDCGRIQMAETTKLKTTQLYKYRWVLITWGIILLVCGLWGFYLWPIISLAGIKMLGFYVGIIFICEGLMAMSVSLFIRELKYWWVPLIEGSISLLSAAIILLVGERSEIVNFVIGGWAISKALLSLTEFGIYQSEIKRIWLLYVKNFFLILLVPLVILAFIYGPRFITLCIAYYFFIHGINFITLCLFGLKDQQSHQEGEL